ncbi:MAG: VWA domain-containing protein [Verrucomicrobiota bacterium]
MNHANEKLSPDDPRLTAFALGELTGEEHAAVAAALAADPALAAEVGKLRAFAAEVKTTLAAEPAPTVAPPVANAAAPLARAAIVHPQEWQQPSEAKAVREKAKVIRLPAFYWIATAAAACFAVVVWLQNPPGQPAAPTMTGNLPAKDTMLAAGEEAVTPPDTAKQVAPVMLVETQTRPSITPSRAANSIDPLRYQPGVTLDVSTVPPATPLPSDAPSGSVVLKTQEASASNFAPSRPALDAVATASATAASSSSIAPPSPGAASGSTGLGQTLDTRSFAVSSGTISTILGGSAGAPGGALAGGGGRGGRAGGFAGGSAPRGGGGGGGRGAAAPIAINVTQQPTIIRVGADPDFFYRYPSLPLDRVIVRRPPPPPAPRESSSGEQYARLRDNAFTDPVQSPLSTFSIDVDTASYANLRSFLTGGRLPPPDAVRIEELVNYFPYHYADARLVERGAAPADGRAAARPAPAAPITTTIESTQAPWLPSHRLVRVALKARDVSAAERGPANLVFLIDVSGSMDAANRLPLVKESLRTLLTRLRSDDRVAIVTYAAGSGISLPSTPVERRNTITDAIDGLRAEGGTNGGAGIQLAYQVAQDNFNKEGVNRIILCTDGDFNVGVTGPALTSMVEDRAKGGVFLTVLGFGRGNLKDATLESLADHGHGNYGYIDTRQEAEKLFVEQLAGTLVTVAKDVKLQVEFNPARVAAWRLIGYEDRLLAAQDFNNDRVDAGVIGAGHTVTALYDIVPVGAEYGYPVPPGTDPLRYTETTAPAPRIDTTRPVVGTNSPELMTVKIRYKLPTADVSEKLEVPFTDGGTKFEQASADLRFVAAVAGFGMVLRESPYRGGTTLTDVLAWAERSVGEDPGGYRAEFLDLVRRARYLRREPAGVTPGQGGTVDPLRY